MMFNLQKKIFRTPSSLKKQNKLTAFAVSLLIMGMLLSGCNPFASQDPVVVANPPTSLSEDAEDAPTQPAEAEPDTAPAEAEETQIPAASPVTVINAPALPDPAGYQFQMVASGLDRPVYLTHAGDDSGRWFVVEKPGRIVIFREGQQLPDPFLDIVSLVNSRDSERGLLGLAFHPEYSQNGLFFVNYTNLNGDTVIARYQVSGNPDLADPNSGTNLLTISQPYANHNGGMIAFGPDGYMYIGMGDGGSGGDPEGNAQNLNSLLGKMLRIDVDAGELYAIPDGNAPEALPEIWAVGVRNPWRFSFDRVTGDLWIGDVGQSQWEEIHFLPAGISGGVNLGWDYLEGTHPYEGEAPNRSNFIFPVIEYGHGGGNCSVTGGYVYRGSMADWQGVYLYGDYCSGTVWGALAGPEGNWQTAELFSMESGLASFGEDEAGELYLVSLNGNLYRLEVN